MKNNLSTKQNGFTLFEILLYMGLSILMVVLIGGIGINILSIYNTSQTDTELQYNSTFAVEKIKLIAAEAVSIQWPVAGVSNTTLSLERSLPENNPTTIKLIDGRLVLQEGEKAPVFLTSSHVVVSAVEFSNVTPETSTGSFRFFLQFAVSNKKNTLAEPIYKNFYTTVNLRYP